MCVCVRACMHACERVRERERERQAGRQAIPLTKHYCKITIAAHPTIDCRLHQTNVCQTNVCVLHLPEKSAQLSITVWSDRLCLLWCSGKLPSCIFICHGGHYAQLVEGNEILPAAITFIALHYHSTCLCLSCHHKSDVAMQIFAYKFTSMNPIGHTHIGCISWRI